jgi:chemotaxis protein methyltransferase CheR
MEYLADTIMPMDISLPAEQLNELIALVKNAHGFDFSGYAKGSLKRRLSRIMVIKHLDFYALKHSLINDPGFFQEFLEEITVNVTEMFRDPGFYSALNTTVMPYLSSYPHIKIWSAGCASGEEAYSLAILLERAGLLTRSFIYGTDINTRMLKNARRGIYTLRNIKTFAGNYRSVGLKGSLTGFFTMMYDAAAIHNELKKHTHFAVHNLVSDSVFNEFQLITCRNVFIYFEVRQQEMILDLFYKSLCPFGFLCLGSKENIRSDMFRTKFKLIDQKENIYQKTEL